jgi:hypothetical protein
MEQFLAAMDGVSNVLYRLEKRRRDRQKQGKTEGANTNQLKSRLCIYAVFRLLAILKVVAFQ